MTLPEKVWWLTNIHKEEKEKMDLFRKLCTFIRPEAFIKKEGEEGEEEITISTEYRKELEEKMGRKLTDEEIKLLEKDLDLVQKVE